LLEPIPEQTVICDLVASRPLSGAFRGLSRCGGHTGQPDLDVGAT